MIYEDLKKYSAKFYEDEKLNISIYEHSMQLLNILNQIKSIYDIDYKLFKDIKKCCLYHDIGKVSDEFQGRKNEKFRKVRHEFLSASYADLTENQRIAILLHHRPINKLVQRLSENITCYYEHKKEVEEKLNIPTIDVKKLLKEIKNTNSCDKLCSLELILLKGYLQLCDFVASAGIKNIDKNLRTFENFKFERYNSIQRNIISNIQKEDVIIKAMTGLGKSATSMFWSNIHQNNDSSRRIFYILPFTASINSMYKEFKALGISTGMLHSKAEYFLYKELKDSENAKSNYNLFKRSIKQVTICTIFQIVKVFLGAGNFEMLLAQLKNSIFIVDEIHCFEIKELVLIIETLKYLKKNLNINVCIMSASIPTCLLDFIKGQLGIVKVITADEEDLIIRHKVNYCDDIIINNLHRIEEDLNRNKQVLVCVNSVRLSQKIFDIFAKKYNVKLIHGKFNTRDREDIEKDLKTCQLLIGTQSIEVSLNISYDVMYTEIAPFDALLQRFGRVNRKGEKGISDIYIFQDTSKIYDNYTIDKTLEVLKQIILNDQAIIQENKIDYYLDQVYEEFDLTKYNKISDVYNSIMTKIKCGVYDNNYDELENNFGISVLPDNL